MSAQWTYNAGVKKEARLFLRVSPAELQAFATCAGLDGLTVSSWARQALNIRASVYVQPEPVKPPARSVTREACASRVPPNSFCKECGKIHQ